VIDNRCITLTFQIYKTSPLYFTKHQHCNLQNMSKFTI